MVDGTQVNAHTNGSTCDTYACGLGKMNILLIADGIYQPSYHHRKDDEQIVVGHLHVVGVNLECSENGCEQESPQIFASIGQHKSCYQWWQIGQSPHLPDVSCSDDDKEIGAERPNYGT